ncbi:MULTISPECIES: chemotaxis protein CheW [unclassified Caballeronia]|uniref:chemotaxis protein CheW n=1 Tax=unclassified Caballeronia TaxID=2646786 RepID=UPI0020299BE5|nr:MULTISPECIES: chemotaxis protein CheW [unclassified Caballeronia]
MMDSSALVVGVVQVGSIRFGIPVEHIVEAVEAPSAYQQIPGQPASMKGYFLLRGDAVATLDTYGLICPDETAPAQARHVIVLRQGDAVFGIEVDAVGKTEAIDRDSLITLAPDDESAAGLFPVLAALGEPSSLIGISNVGKLYEATAGRAARKAIRPRDMAENIESAGDCSNDEAKSRRRQHAIVRCGEHLLGVDALSVRCVIPMPELQQPSPGNTTFLGVAHWLGADLAVMDLPAVLGLPQRETGQGKYLLVLAHGDRVTGFAVDELSELVLLAPKDIRPVSPAAFAEPGFFFGAIGTSRSRTALVMNPGALSSSGRLMYLARAAAAQNGSATGASTAAYTGSYLVFSVAGRPYATNIEHVAGIVTMPKVEMRGRADKASLGLITWRDDYVELVSLHLAAGSDVESFEPRQALVVVVGGLTLAFAVDAVLTMSGPTEATQISRAVDRETGGTYQIVTMTEPSRISYRLVDLAGKVSARFHSLNGRNEEAA